MAVKCAIVGAGSRSFGMSTVQDLLMSDALCAEGLEIALMDIKADHLRGIVEHTEQLRARLGRTVKVKATTNLDEALRGTRFAICAIEVDRNLYWTQDFHIPRDYGFRQIYGENGGVGGIFHALRNMGPMVEIAKRMEALCPDGVLLNFTNPEHKLCEAITRLTSVETYGLCHGVFMGQRQIAAILGMQESDLVMSACGINHFTWFQEIRDRNTGADLYPRLKEIDRQGDMFIEWHEIALGRILLRRFGLWPSPGANHYGEYIRWADEYVVSNLQFHYDPAAGTPWKTGKIPPFVYYANEAKTGGPWHPRPEAPPKDAEVKDAATKDAPAKAGAQADAPLKPSGEIAIKIIESLACGKAQELEAVNVPNRGWIPNLEEGTVVEVPAAADGKGVRPRVMKPLPDAVAAMLRVQGSIHRLIVEAYAEKSKDKLLQAILLDPTVDSYRRAVDLADHMLELQKGILPPLR